jgi:hypothetical protein
MEIRVIARHPRRELSRIEAAKDSLMTTERRSYGRSNLRVPVFLLPMGSSISIRAETENVSLDGFFCHIGCLFSPGDRLKFLLVLPSAARESQSATGMCVHGEIEIVRVVVGPSNCTYGVGCHLCSYRILPESDLLNLDELLATVSQVDDRQ